MIVMSKKKGFRKEWRTLTELGQEFGISAVKFGNLLKQHDLREKSGEPTRFARENGFVQEINPKDSKSYFLWHQKKTSDRLVALGVEKFGVSAKEASKMTEARKLAREYLDALKLDDDGSKMGYIMFQEIMPEVKKIGVEIFNKALLSVGYKGEEVTTEGW